MSSVCHQIIGSKTLRSRFNTSTAASITRLSFSAYSSPLIFLVSSTDPFIVILSICFATYSSSMSKLSGYTRSLIIFL